MRLVLDSNIIFAAILKNSTTRNILVSDEFEFFLSEFALVEIDKHRPYLLDKARVSDSEFKRIVNLLIERTTLVPDNTLAQYVEQANEIMKDIDPDDAPFLALALSFHNDGIWSNDKDFERAGAFPFLCVTSAFMKLRFTAMNENVCRATPSLAGSL